MEIQIMQFLLSGVLMAELEGRCLILSAFPLKLFSENMTSFSNSLEKK